MVVSCWSNPVLRDAHVASRGMGGHSSLGTKVTASKGVNEVTDHGRKPGPRPGWAIGAPEFDRSGVSSLGLTPKSAPAFRFAVSVVEKTDIGLLFLGEKVRLQRLAGVSEGLGHRLFHEGGG